jgi:hypothetical protein
LIQTNQVSIGHFCKFFIDSLILGSKKNTQIILDKDVDKWQPVVDSREATKKTVLILLPKYHVLEILFEYKTKCMNAREVSTNFKNHGSLENK